MNNNQTNSGLMNKVGAITALGAKVLMPIGIIILGIFLFGVLSLIKSPPEQKTITQAIPQVDSMPLKLKLTSLDIQGFGTVQSQRKIKLTAEVAGKITYVAPAFKTGGFVKQDEILLKIDSSRYQAALASAKANVATAKAEINRLQQSRKYQKQTLKLLTEKVAIVEKNYKRFTKTKGAISKKRLASERAKFLQEKQGLIQLQETVATFPAQISKAKADLERQKANLVSAQNDLDNTEIKAAFSSQITAKTVDIGQSVSVGTPLGAIAYDKVYEIPVMVDQEQIYKIPNLPADTLPEEVRNIEELVGTPEAKVKWMNYDGNFTWTGHLVRVEPINLKTRAVPLIVEVKDPWGSLSKGGLPLGVGYYCKVSIEGYKKKAYTIPTSGLRENNTVYLLRNNQLAIEKVHILHRLSDEIIVLPAQKNTSWANTQLITSNVAYPVSGMPLEKRTTRTNP